MVDNMRKGAKGFVYDISVDYNIIDISDSVNVPKYSMKNLDTK